MGAKRASRDPVADVCDQLVAGLQDAIADLKIIRAGRGTCERIRAVSALLYEAQDALRSIDPLWIEIRRKEAEAATGAPVPLKRIAAAPAAKQLFHDPSG